MYFVINTVSNIVSFFIKYPTVKIHVVGMYLMVVFADISEQVLLSLFFFFSFIYVEYRSFKVK